jgi:hypothetical protein
MGIHWVAAIFEIWMHLWVGHHLRTRVLEQDFDTAGPDTQPSAAADVQH